MRIAYLTSRVPYPPIGGDRTRAFHVLRHLVRSHEVIVYALDSSLARADGSRSPELARMVEKRFQVSTAGYGWNAVKGLFSGMPFQVRLYDCASLRRALAEDYERSAFDLLMVHLIRMAEYAKPFAGVPRVLDMTDSLCLHYHRMPRIWRSPLWLAARLDRDRVCRYEAEMPALFDWILLSSPVDLAALRERTGAENLVLLPNGVDLHEFSFAEGMVDANRIIFFGKLDTLPNSDAAQYFAREILPLVKELEPGAHFVVAGWNPPRAIRALARMPGVTVRANVPDIKVEVSRSVVSVAPLRFGAGTQYKILESLALGVPVVATPEPARALVDERDGPILVGRKPEQFADHVARLLTDAAYRERLGRAGRSLVELRYTWERVLAPLDRVLETVTKLSRRSSCVSRAAP
jgi:glycosyltransferase involved in cell wall biosynthesis